MDAKAIQEFFCDFVKDGEILETPVGRTGKKKLERRRIEFIRQFIDVLLHTDIIHEDTKVYLTTGYISLAEYARQYKSDEREDTVTQRITRDINKIKRLFGDRVIVDIVHYPNTDIGVYEQKLEDVLHRSTNRHLLDDRIVLKLPKDGEGKNVTPEGFKGFIGTISVFSYSNMKEIEKWVDKNAAAYARGLLGKTLLTENEKKDKIELERILGIENDSQEL